jgi:hypothetical protein
MQLIFWQLEAPFVTWSHFPGVRVRVRVKVFHLIVYSVPHGSTTTVRFGFSYPATAAATFNST